MQQNFLIATVPVAVAVQSKNVLTEMNGTTNNTEAQRWGPHHCETVSIRVLPTSVSCFLQARTHVLLFVCGAAL